MTCRCHWYDFTTNEVASTQLIYSPVYIVASVMFVEARSRVTSSEVPQERPLLSNVAAE